MLEALMESSQGGRRTVLQYIKMLSVVALPVAAVIGLVSYSLHSNRFLATRYEMVAAKSLSGTSHSVTSRTPNQ